MDIQYLSHNVYGTNSALSVNATQYNGIPSINIDFGSKDHSRQNAWDWNHKVSFLITANELPYFIGVFLGINQTCIGSYHGAGKDKFFKFTKQADGIYVTANSPGRTFSMKISPIDIFHIMCKVIPHVKPNFGNLSIDELGRLIKCTIGHYEKLQKVG
jgi:hypothetical protein